MQIAVIEYARNVLGLDGANSGEFNDKTLYPVITIMDDQRDCRQRSNNAPGLIRMPLD
ncbi:MAG: hypothetical protein ACLUKN_11655 [Bacilli bacterium]